MSEKINWIETALRCFEASQAKELHVNTMAEIALEKRIIKQIISHEDIAKGLSASLSLQVKRKESLFRKVSNGKNGFKKGIYRLKAIQKPTIAIPEIQKVSSLYTGRAGEHAVLSELLFRGYNASLMTVDDGIDVVASRNNKYFHIQVKTANSADDKRYSASILTESFQYASGTFYVIVLRRRLKDRFINDFAVFGASDIRNFTKSGQIKEGQTISLNISLENGIYSLNKMNINHLINDFNAIQ